MDGLTPMDEETTMEQVDNSGDTRVVDTIKYEGKPSAKYVPEGFKSVKAFLADMRKKHAAGLEADDENRREAIDDKKFAAGEQWDPIVLENRRGLPNLVINTVPQFTAQLVGDFRDSRNGIKVLPQEDGDVEIARIRSDLVRSIETKSRASRVYDQAFESSVQCGDGAFRVCVDYTRDDVFEQEVLLKPIEDCLSVVWDALSIDSTGADARHVFVDDSIDRGEFDRKWPGMDPSTLGESTYAECRRGGWIDNDSVKVTEYWRMIERDRLLFLFEDGAIIAMDDESALEKLIEQHGNVIRSRVAPCLYAQMHLVTGHAILAGPYEYKINRVPIIRMTGRTVNIAGRRVRYGLVRFMKDAVRLRNFWRSTAAEQLGYAPKAQWWATEDAVAGREEDLRKAHLSRDPLLIFNDEAEYNRNFGRLDPPAPQMALLNEAQVNTQDMKDVTGIHDASLGIRSNETSGKAINARQREGDIASMTYFDNANQAILEAGNVINQLIPQIYDSTRIVRLIGEDEEMRMVRINDPSDEYSPDLSVGHYDVALSTGTSYQTRRVEAAEAMMNAVQVYPEIMSIAGDLVVKAQDWPGAEKLAERLKKTLPPQLLEGEDGAQAQPQIPPEIEQAMQEMQMELQTTQQELEALKRDKDIEAYEAETKRIDVLTKNELKGTDIAVKALSEAQRSKDVSKPEPKGSTTPKGDSATQK